MNKMNYKLVFSKAKAMLIAVGENARGYNHNTSQVKKQDTGNNSQTKKTIIHDIQGSKTLRFNTFILSLWTALTPIVPNWVYAQSQIQTYDQGNSIYRPTLLRSNNDIPIVNIRSINDAGVSRNQFGQFDIDEKGVVLNNARFSTNSQLAGQINGNFFLLSGEARTIVNEVYNANPTRLNGKIEVAGQTANVIIASPSGLTINGGGFINANNSVLTTGNIDYNQGSPVGVQVEQGTIQILDKGLFYQNDGKNAPYFSQIFSQTANINGRITGHDNTLIQVVIGENAIGLSETVNTTDIKPKVQSNTSPAHDGNNRISVDIGQMGQVYAGGIHIVSTSDGMGVKQAGKLKANHFITLQADGKIVNYGDIKTNSNYGQILLKNNKDNADITNTGNIQSANEVMLVSAHDIKNTDTGEIHGQQQTSLIANNNIDFDKINYQNTDTNLVLQAGNSIQSQQNIVVDTAGEIDLQAGKSLDLNQAKIQSHKVTSSDNNSPNISSNIKLVSQDLTITGSHIQNKAGEIYLGAKNLTARSNKIYGGSDGQKATVNMIADNVMLSDNQIETVGSLNIAGNNHLAAQNNKLKAKDLTLVSTAHITLEHNKVNTPEQFGVVAGQDLKFTDNQVQAGIVTVRSEQGHLTVIDSQIRSDSHLYLQGKEQEGSNNELVANDNISIHSQKSNSLTNTQLNAGKHVAISSKEADVTIRNTDKNILANGLISIQADKDVKLNQSRIQGGAIALHSKGAGVDWQNAKLNTVKHDVLAQDEQLKTVNGSLVIKSHNDMTVLAGKTVQSAGDLELQSDGDLILQGLKGSNGRGSEQKVTINSGGTVYLKGKNTDLQGTDIAAQGIIKAYAVDGNLKLSAITSDIAPIKDENRINELTAQINEIDRQINTLKTDTIYQNTLIQYTEAQEKLTALESNFKTLSNPTTQQEDEYQAQKTALNQQIQQLSRDLLARQTALGIEKEPQQLEQEKNILSKSLKIAETPFDGSENKGTSLTATGNIELVAKDAVTIQQATLNTTDYAIIQALGTGAEREIGKDEQGQALTMPFAVSIEGLHDIYQRGQENEDSFSLHNNYQPTTIKADKGIIIQAIGTGEITPNQSTAKSSPYNILMVGGDYQAKDGTISIQSLGSTLLQAGQDSIYDQETKTSVKRSWAGAKKKITITTTTEQVQDADVVKLAAKNIQIQAGDHIYAYGTTFNAQDNSTDKNNVLLQAGDSVRLLAVSEVNQKDVDVKKTSSFLGIRYNKSKTHDSRQVLSELPTKLVADITQTQSGADTELQGTQFHTLEEAQIVAGVGVKAIPDAKIILGTISTTIQEEKTREFNNLVWQSISNQGSITETASLPLFTGVEPTLTATGGIFVQVPIDKNDPNQKEHLVNVLDRLSHEPGFNYLEGVIQRDDVDFTAVKLAQEQWDYKQEGLTPAAAALIAIAVTIATSGAGAAGVASLGVTTTTATGSFTVAGAMANAAFSSLVSQASITLINNKGNVGQTLKDLGHSSTVKQIAQATITAGVTQGLDNYLDKAFQSTKALENGASVQASINEKIIRGVVQGTGNALTDSLLNGTDLETALKNNLTAQFVDGITSSIYSNGVKRLDDDTLIANISHKLAAGLTGCLSSKAKDKSCEAGAVGAVIGEMVGDWMIDDDVQARINSGEIQPGTEEYNRILNTAKLTAGAVALLYDFDVDTAVGSADQAIVNNALENTSDLACKEEEDAACQVKKDRRILVNAIYKINNGINKVVSTVVPIFTSWFNVIIGKDAITGEKLSDEDRFLSAAPGGVAVKHILPDIVVIAKEGERSIWGKIKDAVSSWLSKPSSASVLSKAPVYNLNKGSINVKEIKEYGKSIKLPSQAQPLLEQLKHTNDPRKIGEIGEEIANMIKPKKAITHYSKCKSNNCFDQVYEYKGELYIVEVKTTRSEKPGSITLNKTLTKDVQMTDEWISGSIQDLQNDTINPGAKQTGEMFEKAINKGTAIHKMIIHITPDGATLLNLGKYKPNKIGD